MNLDSLSFALSNISYSVANLTKKNFKSSVQEITRLVTCHGLEAERHLLRCLFSHVDFSGDGKSSGKDFHQTQLLIQECASILHKPNFVSTFCYAIDCPLQQQKSLRPSSSLLSQLSKVLKLSSVQEIAFGLALLHSSIPDHINHSVNFLKLKLPDFIRNICDQDLSSLEDSFDLPPVIVHLLLHQLNCGNKDLGISSESKEKLNKRLSLDFADKVPLLPYLRVDNLDPMMENIGNVPKSSDDSLVEVIQEMGYNFTASVEECKNNMAQIGLREIKPSLVARVLSMMARSHTGLTDAMPLQNMNSNMVMWGGEKEKSEVNQQATWNVEVFVQAVRDLAPSLDWKEIVHDLDNPDFLLKDRKGLKLLWQGLILGLSQETFPMDRMYRRWRNSEGQFSFFQQVLNCCDIVCLTDYPHRPVLTDALKAPPEDDNKSISNWKSLDLIETLLCLSETPFFKDELFKFPLAHCPDLLILGLIQTSRAINPLHKELLSNLIPIFLGNHPNSAMVFHLAWHSQVLYTYIEIFFKGDGGNTAFPPLSLGSFTIPSSGSPAKMLSVGTPAIKSGTTSSQITQSQFSNVMASGTPQLPTQFGDVGQILTESSGPVSKEIEDEANSYFQRIYNHAPHSSLPIEEVLDMLKRFKESPIQREREVCSCMIKNLFEEYRFFPQYPDKELQITAQLFGGIVDQNLVSYLSLGLALRYVLESVKKPSNSKMFFFGVTAMDRFKTRLKDYPAYCQHLTTLPNFHELPQNLVEYIEYGARSQEPPLNRPVTVSQALNTTSAFPNITQAPSMPLTTTTTTVTITTATPKITGKPSIANATNIDTLLGATEKDEKLVNPPDSVQDKVSFIVNNLSQSNLSQKTEEFREIVKEEYWPWASQYLVMKRASIEPNFHTLYSNFLDTLKLSDLTKLVIRETFRNIKVLLRSDKTVANFSDRSLLKNLGHWLGILTLAKCKPILQVDIDIKSLIIEAYHNGSHELLYVVPFVAKVLESCAKSKVFKPPNPWTMGIMKVLCELHKEPDLKLNLKFEIEVLCKTLNIDINEIKPSGILKDQDRILKIDSQLSPLPKHKEQQAVGSVNIQVPPQPALSNVVPPTANPLANNVLHEENIPTLGSPPTTLSSGQIPPLCAAAPPQPHFAYGDINIVNLSQIAQHLNINSTIPLFQTHSQLKQFVRVAIERAVQEWLAPVVERSVKISLTTCEQIIKKDFALDPEEARMRASAHHMIRSLTAGMVMITCRDPLFVSIITNLRTAFLGALRNPTPQQKELTEQAAEVVATENLELACCFIQKTAVEKALPEIDKRLASEYEARKHARSEGRRYCDPVALTYQAERMPEQIRLKVGGVTPQQMAVYEEFARMIPGFLPSGEREQQQANLGRSVAVSDLLMMQPYATDEMSQIYDKLISELEMLLHATNHSNPHILALHSLLEAVLMARNTREMTSAVALLQKAVDGFLEGMCQAASDSDVSMRFRDGHLLVMKALADPRVYGHQWTSKQITRWLIESREECRYNPEAVDLLIRNHLINLQAYDLHLTQSMENGMNMMAVQFAMQLVKMYLLDERHTGLVSEADLYNTVETLGRITSNQRQLPDGLNQLLDMLRSTGEPFLDRAPGSGPIGMMYSGITQAREFDDPPGLYEKTEFLLREWVTMYHSPKAGKDSTNAFSLFVHQMNLQGILKTDELITRFFRLSTEMCVDLSYRVLMDQNLKSPTVIRAKCFHTLDAYVRLIALLVKHSGDNNNTVTKVNLLNKVLGIVTGVLLQDQELRGVEFQQLPYHRIFIMLFLELSAPEAVLEAINPQILTAFCNTLYYLRPQKAPGFAYAWLELVSHRVFLGRVLALSPAQKGWTMYAQLLVSLFKFLAPFLRNVELAAPIQLLYKGTLRVLLVLLHDFPENHASSQNPCKFQQSDSTTFIQKGLGFIHQNKSPVTFLSELRTSLQVSNEPGMRYNIPLINALVLYVGTQAIQYIQNKGNTPNMSTITHSSHMDIFQNLAVDSDTEGRYLFLNAIANQLRYPNSHTHYFSCTLLYLFAEANTEAIQEQITRVLLERLIVNRPHPWGLLITFIELIKNQNFKFWNHEFVRCAPEIEKLFESVARSCMHPKPSSEQTTSVKTHATDLIFKRCHQADVAFQSQISHSTIVPLLLRFVLKIMNGGEKLEQGFEIKTSNSCLLDTCKSDRQIPSSTPMEGQVGLWFHEKHPKNPGKISLLCEAQ
ncbi:CCR4-NOT transcription complex subunit 1 like protein [Argiope bruennichi]|uniref:CCR4-NOT transcription complex subunit 1 n=1 Tax=Argiope bruennichi TaxID=94029 RepID=A0A8T0EL32_ARGBR|nr:CCR4-NOT transcription complex subunit 1 like protein [Argiope bruennichi]